jgi:hypothetical protein
VAVDDAGQASTYDGHWSKPVPVVTGGLLAVSCAGPTFCMAVGWPGPGVAVDSHGNWSTSSGTADGVQGSLTGVSCVSVSFCVAAGTVQEQGPPGTTAFVQTFDGHSWTAILNQDLTGYGSGDFMQTVSCLSISFCVAVGTVGDRGDIGGLVDADTAGTWTWQQISDDRMAPSFADQGGLNAVACGAVNSCVAAGPSGYVFSDDGNGWTRHIGDPVAPVTAVSCPDASTCLAVDSVGNVLVDQGGDWEVSQTIDPDHDLTSLSCPTTQFCVAVDSTGDVLIGDT